jgi:TolA-binding protein
MSMTRDDLVGHEPDIVELAKRLSWKPLTDEHRRRLAAEVMAQADVAVVRSRRRGWTIAGVVAAAAVLLVVGLGRDHQVADAPAVTASQSPEMVETSGRSVSALEAPVEAPPAARELHGVVQLHDGELTIDTRTREPVTIVTGQTRVTITSSRATVVARRGVIVTAQVFAGTAEITEAGHTRIVEAGEVWTPSPAASSLQEFRAGYELLRDGKYEEAIEAFDHATDPVVDEDARFWAAIAAERAGNKEDAAKRLNAFMRAFPASPRLDDARSALERVTR